MPPPSAKRPFGAAAIALFPVTLLLVRVTVPGHQSLMPPPSASLASPAAVLSLTVVLTKLRRPQLSIPPPFAHASGQWTPPGHGGPNGRVSVDATRFPAMTLLPIVTVGP